MENGLRRNVKRSNKKIAMKVINLGAENSIFNQFISEIDFNNINIENKYDLLTNYQDTIVKFENKLVEI